MEESKERQYWKVLAKEKQEHEAMYTNSVYRHQRTKDKNLEKGKNRNGGEEADAESFSSFLTPDVVVPDLL